MSVADGWEEVMHHLQPHICYADVSKQTQQCVAEERGGGIFYSFSSFNRDFHCKFSKLSKQHKFLYDMVSVSGLQPFTVATLRISGLGRAEARAGAAPGS